MNIYRQERIDMIVAMMMVLAGIPEKRAMELLELTMTYKNIMDGEECTLYESYSANLEEAAEELINCGEKEVIENITEDTVSGLNMWMHDNGIKNAKQLKENMYTRLQ